MSFCLNRMIVQFGKQQSCHKNISSSIVLYTSGQTSDSRRHSTCWVSPHGSTLYQHAVPWTQVICSTQPSPVHLLGMHSTSNRDTHLYPLHNSYSSTDNNTAVGRSGGSPMECGEVGWHFETPYFHPRHRHPPSWNGPSKDSACTS